MCAKLKTNQSNNLRLWRESRSWTQPELAEKLRVGVGTVSQIELGKQQPRAALLRQICGLFRQDESDFYAVAKAGRVVTIGEFSVPFVPYIDLCSTEPLPAKVEKKLRTDEDYTQGSFAFEIFSEDNAPQYNPGDVVILSPEEKPEPYKMVLACVGGSPFFRQYRETGVGGSSFNLVPLREGYASISSETIGSVRILGVEVEYRRYAGKRFPQVLAK